MKHSYIANPQEAAALHAGKQTAIVVKMKLQPPRYGISIRDGYGLIEDPEGNVHAKFKTPYQLGQEVYVREKWGNMNLTRYTTCMLPIPLKGLKHTCTATQFAMCHLGNPPPPCRNQQHEHDLKG